MFVCEQLLKTDIQIPSSFAVNMGTQHMWQNKKKPLFLQLINLLAFDLRAQPEAELRKMSLCPFSSSPGCISFSV